MKDYHLKLGFLIRLQLALLKYLDNKAYERLLERIRDINKANKLKIPNHIRLTKKRCNKWDKWFNEPIPTQKELFGMGLK